MSIIKHEKLIEMQFKFEIDIKTWAGHQILARLHNKKTSFILCIGAYPRDAVSKN